jgi:hypothetical protein
MILIILLTCNIIRWIYASPIAVNPGARWIINALESLSVKKSKKRKEQDSRKKPHE